MQGLFFRAIVAAVALSALPSFGQEKGIHHRLLLEDESRSRMHYVDTSDPAKHWEIVFPARYRDYQLIGQNRLLMNNLSGYSEYDLNSRKLLKEFKDPRFAGTQSARRLPDGRTLLGCNAVLDPKKDPKKSGIKFFELDKDDKLLRTAVFPELDTLRLFRLSQKGNLLFGSHDKVVEADLDGHVIRQFRVEGGKHMYQVLERPDGHLLAAGGYGAFVVELDPQGKVVRKWGGLPPLDKLGAAVSKAEPPGPKDMGYHFFAGFQVLKNGHLVVTNWTGHGANDSVKGHQVLEFDADGNLLWSWHDPALAGTIHGVIVLDDLDTARFNDDTSGVLGPAR